MGILLPKESRLLKEVLADIEKVGLRLRNMGDQQVLVDERAELPDLPVTVRRQKVIYKKLRENRKRSMAIIGLDKLAEIDLGVKDQTPFDERYERLTRGEVYRRLNFGDNVEFSRNVEVRTKLPSGKCRLSFCDSANREEALSMDHFSGDIPTTYPNIVRTLFSKYGNHSPNIIPNEGDTEEEAQEIDAPTLEIVQSGGSLRKVQYKENFTLFESSAVFVTSSGLSDLELSLAEKLNSRFREIKGNENQFSETERAYLESLVVFASTKNPKTESSTPAAVQPVPLQQ